MVICLERGADLHMAQLMPLPLTVSCFSKIQIGVALLVPAHPGSAGQRAVKRMYVYILLLCVFFVFFPSPLARVCVCFSRPIARNVLILSFVLSLWTVVAAYIAFLTRPA